MRRHRPSTTGPEVVRDVFWSMGNARRLFGPSDLISHLVNSGLNERKVMLAMPDVKTNPFFSREGTEYRVRRKVAIVRVKLFDRLQKAFVLL